MMKTVILFALGLFASGVLAGCVSNASREPQQVVGDVGDKSATTASVEKIVNNGKSYSECWITKLSGDGVAEYHRAMVTYNLMGMDKFSKESMVLETSSFKFYNSNNERFARKTQKIIKNLIEEATDNCDSLKEGVH